MIDQAIIMAGGSSTRLSPCRINKHLLPVYDKPMIYYSLATLMLAGIKKFYLVCDPDSLTNYERALDYGSKYGIQIVHVIQQEPKGIADGINLCAEYMKQAPFAMILGDNIFHGHGFTEQVVEALEYIKGPDYLHPQPDGVVFTKEVADPRRYGVATLNELCQIIKIVEKPEEPESNQAVTGLYVYSPAVFDIARDLKPSARGELEITDLNNKLIERNKLWVSQIGRGTAWLDTGTPQALLRAAEYVATIQERQGTIIACLEEIAKSQGWLTELPTSRYTKYHNTTYDNYVKQLFD